MKNLIITSIFIFSFSAFSQEAPINNSSPLQKAVSTGDLKSVSKILSADAKQLNATDKEGMTPLMTAASNGQVKIVQELLKRKADKEVKNKLGDTALSIAVTYEQFEAAKVLIKSGANVDVTVAGEDKDTLLMSAVSLNTEIAKMILAKNKNTINKTNKDGTTALMKTILNNQQESLKLLLGQGADTKLKDKDGKTALDIAKEFRNQTAIKLLSAKK